MSMNMFVFYNYVLTKLRDNGYVKNKYFDIKHYYF